VKIKRLGDVDPGLLEWNDQMYSKHPTPYTGIAGFIERARVRAVLKLAEVGHNDSVLEIGCESGNLLASIPDAKRIVGADISQVALEDAANRFEGRQLLPEFLQLDAQQPLGFSAGEFDVIICSETLEHVHDPRSLLENIHKISTPDTRIVISVPIEAPKIFVKKLLNVTGLFKLFFKGIEMRQSEWHLQAFSKEDLHDISSGLFEVTRDKTVWAIHYVVRLSKK